MHEHTIKLARAHASQADIEESNQTVRFVPQSVNSSSDPCCTLHEWLVLPPCDSTKFYADAAFPTPRAHAARNRIHRLGSFETFAASAPTAGTLADTFHEYRMKAA